jgi:polyisoprenoid-binding protein YceI
MIKSNNLIALLLNITTLVLLSGVAGNIQASWTLQPSSSHIHFLSIKATHIGEVHSFTKFKGSVQDNGLARIQIDLSSVDTLIPIRNERMRNLLFAINEHPTATINTKISIAEFKDIKIGSEVGTQIEAGLEFKGTNNQVIADIIVSRQNESTFTIQSRSPLLLSATDLGIIEGIEKLREIAGLTNISFSIPASFRLTFKES